MHWFVMRAIDYSVIVIIVSLVNESFFYQSSLLAKISDYVLIVVLLNTKEIEYYFTNELIWREL